MSENVAYAMGHLGIEPRIGSKPRITFVLGRDICENTKLGAFCAGGFVTTSLSDRHN
jgi:hypothetical protein